MRNYDLEVPVSDNNLSITKNYDKCITCGYCRKACVVDETQQEMLKTNPNKEIVCINCGQCTNICPTESLSEVFAYKKVKSILNNKNGNTIVFNIAPAVRVALAEEFNAKNSINVESKIVTALKKIGADYVFDITFGADLTIMEEAMELVNRIKNNGVLPQFTSCCPAWVKYLEIYHPDFISNLSTAKSPIAMQGTMIKTYFANIKKIDPEKIINIVVAPCTAKKMEIERDEINYTQKDTDYILTTRELALLLKEENIDIMNLEETNFDSPLGKGSSAGVIFGASGGVCEAAIRTAYYFLTGENMKKEDLVLSSIRGNSSIKEATININNRKIKVAVCNGIKSAESIILKIKNKEVNYDFIEVMTCLGGCSGGGGQPKITMLDMLEVKEDRMNTLYKEDEKMTLRLCHENPEIKEIYASYLGVPNSIVAEKLLHTNYKDKSYMLGGKKNE
ncbi:MAG: [Bacilli bacterium]|nr:[FeFe] hydrogenase, group A [Bacilli bacterium]